MGDLVKCFLCLRISSTLMIMMMTKMTEITGISICNGRSGLLGLDVDCMDVKSLSVAFGSRESS